MYIHICIHIYIFAYIYICVYVTYVNGTNQEIMIEYHVKNAIHIIIMKQLRLDTQTYRSLRTHKDKQANIQEGTGADRKKYTHRQKHIRKKPR